MYRSRYILGFVILLITFAAVVLFMEDCGHQQAEIETFKASFIRAVKDAYEKGEVNELDKFFTADFVRHDPPNPDIKGLDAYKQAIVDARRIYSNPRLTINSMIMEGNASAGRWTFQATHSPTGKQIYMTGCTMYRWENSKAVECWHHGDRLGMLQQLGYKMSPPLTDKTFARVTITQSKVDSINESIKIYKESVVPAAQSQNGYRGAYLLSDSKTGKGISITLWNSEANAIANEQSGYYREQVGKFKDFFTANPVREGYTVTVQE